jgi:hypothetical protein
MDAYLYWHASTDNDAANRWLRSVMLRCCARRPRAEPRLLDCCPAPVAAPPCAQVTYRGFLPMT